jgi:hypothetical protein
MVAEKTAKIEERKNTSTTTSELELPAEAPHPQSMSFND